MSIFNKSVSNFAGDNSNVDFDLSPGMHQAICVGVCYKEDIEVTFKGETKTQDQIQLFFAAAEGNMVKTIVSRSYNLSFNEKSALSKDIATWGVTIETIADFVGKTCSLVLIKNDKYTNINSILPPQGETKIDLGTVFIPKFWLESDGKPTGFEIKTLDEVGERPAKKED
jgi:hypothetical protein